MLNQTYDPKKYESEIYNNWQSQSLGKIEIQDETQLKYIIFDFDGVLADSYEAEIYALQKTGKFSEIDSVKEYLQEKFLNPSVKNFDDVEEVAVETQKIRKICQYKLEYGFHLFMGFIYELKKLKNFRFAINTTADHSNVDHLLADIDLSFDNIQTLEESLSKNQKNKVIIKDWNLSSNQNVYFITDTVRDYLEVKETIKEQNILAVDWGWQGYQTLIKYMPEKQILKNYQDIHRIFPRHSILMPPPNLTGKMHAGHSFQHFLMDTLSRINRQKGNPSLWYPGVDHAGIQLEGVIDKLIRKGEFDEELKNK